MIVIVADDDKFQRKVMERAVRAVDPDAEIDVVDSGGELVDRVLSREYDFVLTDLDMGTSVDGIEATRRIREAGCETPVYLATMSYGEMGLLQEAHDAGVTAVYGKRLLDRNTSLREVIEKHLGGKQNE